MGEGRPREPRRQGGVTWVEHHRTLNKIARHHDKGTLVNTCGMYNGAGDSILLCDIYHVTQLCLSHPTIRF